MIIDNDETLAHVMSIDLKRIVIKVAESVVDVLKGFVQSEVYNVYEPKVYERQHADGGFYGSWTYDDIKVGAGSLLNSREFGTTIFSDPDEMTLDPMNFIHGSPIGGMFGDIDRRDEMDAAIAESFHKDPRHDVHTKDGSGAWEKPRDYWTPFIDLMDLGIFEDIFEEECRKIGITLI